MKKIILDLCGGTGSWSRHYAEHPDYEVIIVDKTVGLDVLTYNPPEKVHGVLAAPPCTHFAISGARWWSTKQNRIVTHALKIVHYCLDIIETTNPEWWCLENPQGRLPQYIGRPITWFHPCDYGDPYTKRTYLWGNFKMPKRSPVKPTMKNYINNIPHNKHRASIRSITPPGFAKAFFEANP